MKIIDLLNKIANDEVPKKIKYDDRIYTFNEKENNYYENETCSINWDYVALYCLNEPVEIIEEENKSLKFRPTGVKQIERYREEITRLHNIINKTTKLLKQAGSYDEETKQFCDDVWEELPDILSVLEGSDK